MKKRFLLILLAILILFTSCDLTMKQGPKPKIYLVALGLGYEGAGRNQLMNPLNDCKGVVTQFMELCKAGGNECEIVVYSDDLKEAPSDNRFTFRHYSNYKYKVDKPIVYLSDKYDIKSSLDFERALFSQIYEMWNEKPTSNDLLLFYYTGHGVESLDDSRSQEEIDNGTPIVAGLVPFYIIDTHFYYETLNYDQIFRNLDKYPCRQFCILDCCYSGASIENKGNILPRDDNELGDTNGFKENYEDTIRNDLLDKNNISIVFENAWNKTVSGTYGKPKRIVLNASIYSQQALNFDNYKSDIGIQNYGGVTFRLLKYLGYQFTKNADKDYAAPPKQLKGKVVSATSIMKYIYDNISMGLKKVSTPNITRSSYDMAIWDLR